MEQDIHKVMEIKRNALDNIELNNNIVFLANEVERMVDVNFRQLTETIDANFKIKVYKEHFWELTKCGCDWKISHITRLPICNKCNWNKYYITKIENEV